jgi:hypothetical protein
VYPHAELDPVLRPGFCISPSYASLNFDGSAYSVYDTGKFDQNTVAHWFDNAAMMRLDRRIYELGTNVA